MIRDPPTTAPLPGRHPGAVSPTSPAPPPVRGLIRLLNTTGGRLLCLAGQVDGPAVEEFLRRYGREPAPVDGIDAGSVTALSAPAVDLVLDHLDRARRSGRAVALHCPPSVQRLLAEHPAPRSR